MNKGDIFYMETKLLIELKVLNHQLSQIRRTSPFLPSLTDIYKKVERELYES